MAKETVQQGKEKIKQQSRWPKHDEISKEAKIAYLASTMDVWSGTQERLAISLMPDLVKQRHEKVAKAKQKNIEKRYAKNFYVLDCETSGFKHNEPIQIAVLRFENRR